MCSGGDNIRNVRHHHISVLLLNIQKLLNVPKVKNTLPGGPILVGSAPQAQLYMQRQKGLCGVNLKVFMLLIQ